MQRTFSGTPGSAPVCAAGLLAWGGHTSCVRLASPAMRTIAMLDAGFGIRHLGRELVAMGHRQEQLVIAFSHFHWDHMQGFPCFTPADDVSYNIMMLALGQGWTMRNLREMFAVQMQAQYCPVQLDGMGRDTHVMESMHVSPLPNAPSMMGRDMDTSPHSSHAPQRTGPHRRPATRRGVRPRRRRKARADVHPRLTPNRFWACVALVHEVRPPLTATLSNAQAGWHCLAMDTPDLQVARAALADSIAGARRTNAMARQLQALVTAGTLEQLSLPIHDVIHEPIGLLRSDADAQHVRITRDSRPLFPWYPGDRIQVRHVLVHLVRNAFEAMHQVEEGSRTLVVRTTTTAPGGITVAVQDRGPPIDETRIACLFQNPCGWRPAVVKGTKQQIAPLPINKDGDTLAWLPGVTTFNCHLHVPHDALTTEDTQSVPVLARPPMDLDRPHPCTAAGTRECNACLWMPSQGERGGYILLAASTICTTSCGGTESLQPFWHNVATL